MTPPSRPHWAAVLGCAVLLLLWGSAAPARAAEPRESGRTQSATAAEKLSSPGSGSKAPDSQTPPEDVVLLDEAAPSEAAGEAGKDTSSEAGIDDEATMSIDGAPLSEESTDDSDAELAERPVETGTREAGRLRLSWGTRRESGAATAAPSPSPKSQRKPRGAAGRDGRFLIGASITTGGLFLDSVRYSSDSEVIEGATFEGGTFAPLLGTLEAGYEFRGTHQLLASLSVGGNAISGAVTGEALQASWLALAGYRPRLSLGPVHPFVGFSAGVASLQAAVEFPAAGVWVLSSHQGFALQGQAGVEVGSPRVRAVVDARVLRVFASSSATLIGGEVGLRFGF